MANASEALERLCDPEPGVSAHYLIRADGVVHQLVDEAARAWHAGAGTWQGFDDINSRSIGIELDNNGLVPFAAAQMDALEDLLAGIMGRWDISASGVIGHSDMAPGRKGDPGRRFDWRRLALGGFAVWPDAKIGAGDFYENLGRFGYDLGAGKEPVLAAFRLRFSPHICGDVTQAEQAIAQALVDQL